MPEIKIFDALPEEEILAQMAEECVEASKAVCGNESCEHYQPSGSYMLPPTCAINGCCLSKPPQSWCYVAEAKEDDAL